MPARTLPAIETQLVDAIAAGTVTTAVKIADPTLAGLPAWPTGTSPWTNPNLIVDR